MTNRIFNMTKILVVLVFFGCGNMFAQEVTLNEVIYKVEKDVILKEGTDVTSNLSEEQKTKILQLAKDKRLQETADSEKAKELKEAEKREKRIHKKRKKTQKALKQAEKRQDNFNSADKKYKKTLAKYKKLKEKGKLSPADETKMLEKIDKLNQKLDKAKRKLK
ncbi:coiled-coil domain-containing protein [Seonamhaeicola marinus]|uniref:Uncharacterized protein n=1 Tax=Seonamhaeicola marinus TaxID=1912246 RepID=A0A5D0HFF3_9FLAO|nr:hypothetical protein [Seonamhaeicola marinus]TYA70055.1 hypothetical protein FUA24_22480 [Seonamhaeicola marinus]